MCASGANLSMAERVRVRAADALTAERRSRQHLIAHAQAAGLQLSCVQADVVLPAVAPAGASQYMELSVQLHS
jgi:hypothetical protein